MRKPLIIALTALTLGAGTFGLANADGEGHHGRHSPAERMERMAEKLGLSDEQRDQIQALMEKQHEQRPARGEGHQVFRDLRELDPAASDYQQRLDELVARAQERFGERLRARAAHRAALAEILTDEQEQKLDEWQKDRREHWKEHGGKRHHGDRDDE